VPILNGIWVNSVSNADGEGQDKDDSLVYKSFAVNEFLVEANSWPLHDIVMINLVWCMAY